MIAFAEDSPVSVIRISGFKKRDGLRLKLLKCMDFELNGFEIVLFRKTKTSPVVIVSGGYKDELDSATA